MKEKLFQCLLLFLTLSLGVVIIFTTLCVVHIKSQQVLISEKDEKIEELYTKNSELEASNEQLMLDLNDITEKVSQLTSIIDDLSSQLSNEKTVTSNQQLEIERLKEFIRTNLGEKLIDNYISAEVDPLLCESNKQSAQNTIIEVQNNLAQFFDAEDPIFSDIDIIHNTIVDFYDRLPTYRPAKGGINSPYGSRKHPITGSTDFHKGVDLSKDSGLDIYAGGKGTVIVAGWDAGYGWHIKIDHGNGYITHYAHIRSKDSMIVKVGEVVEKGQHIAIMGTSGASTGVHLHYEILKDGHTVNPLNYFGE